eukprot:1156351-Pelagomonas_calceolata.AAC.15
MQLQTAWSPTAHDALPVGLISCLPENDGIEGPHIVLLASDHSRNAHSPTLGPTLAPVRTFPGWAEVRLKRLKTLQTHPCFLFDKFPSRISTET